MIDAKIGVIAAALSVAGFQVSGQSVVDRAEGRDWTFYQQTAGGIESTQHDFLARVYASTYQGTASLLNGSGVVGTFQASPWGQSLESLSYSGKYVSPQERLNALGDGPLDFRLDSGTSRPGAVGGIGSIVPGSTNMVGEIVARFSDETVLSVPQVQAGSDLVGSIIIDANSRLDGEVLSRLTVRLYRDGSNIGGYTEWNSLDLGEETRFDFVIDGELLEAGGNYSLVTSTSYRFNGAFSEALGGTLSYSHLTRTTFDFSVPIPAPGVFGVVGFGICGMLRRCRG